MKGPSRIPISPTSCHPHHSYCQPHCPQQSSSLATTAQIKLSPTLFALQVRCPKQGCCCPGRCVGVACPLQCGDCVWTPASFCGLDLCIGMCFCNCADSEHPGSYSCTDLKANTYRMVLVDQEARTYAWFSENEFASKGDDLGVTLYCE